DSDAEIDEPAGIGAFGEVAALHAVAEIVQELGDAAHADAADPSKTQRPDRSGQRSHAARLFFAPPTSGASAIANAARRSAASSRPKRRARAAAWLSLAPSRRSSDRRSARSGGVSEDCGITQPAPASAKARALAAW